MLLTDEVNLVDHPAAQFDRIVPITSVPTERAATTTMETQLGNFFAQASTMLSELEPGSLLWLHSRGLAGDWDAPYDYRVRLADDEDPAPPTFVKSPATWIDPKTADPDELLGFQQAMAAQVFLIDELLGVFLDVLKSLPIWQSTLLCVASPRGCGLGEHGLVGPGDQLFSESIQVPLMIRIPGQNAWQAARTSRLIPVGQLSQILNNWFTLEQESFSQELARFAPVLPNKLQECILLTSEEQESIQTHAWKLIRSKMGGVQLFAKPDDRSEVNDVSDRCPDIVRKLITLMEVLQKNDPGRTLHHVELSTELTN